MNDRRESDSDSPEIAEVRRLLADARHTEPIPAEVSARLDDVLLGLTAEGTPASPTTPATPPTPATPEAGRDASVTPIAAHRRRRAAAMLVAAAAIVVGGVVAAQNLHLPSSSSSGNTASAAENAPRAPQDQQLGNTGNAGNNHVPKARNSTPPAPTSGRAAPVLVRPGHFAEDARQGRALLGRLDAVKAFSTTSDCATLAKRARVVPAEYRNAPAALVYRRPQGSSQVVDLYVCGSPQPVRSTTLPAP